MYMCVHVHRRLGGEASTRKSFRFVRSCVRARGLVVEWKSGSNVVAGVFPFPFWPWEVFPFPLRVPPPPNRLSNFSWPYR